MRRVGELEAIREAGTDTESVWKLCLEQPHIREYIPDDIPPNRSYLVKVGDLSYF